MQYIHKFKKQELIQKQSWHQRHPNEHEMHVGQKVAGGLGGAVSPLVGWWQGPGGGWVGKDPKFFLAFWCPKDIK